MQAVGVRTFLVGVGVEAADVDHVELGAEISLDEPCYYPQLLPQTAGVIGLGL